MTTFLGFLVVYNAGVLDGTPGKVVKSTPELMECLTKSNVHMYGSPKCGHCQQQKAMIGEPFMYVDFVNCDEEPGATSCTEHAIEG